MLTMQVMACMGIIIGLSLLLGINLRILPVIFLRGCWTDPKVSERRF